MLRNRIRRFVQKSTSWRTIRRCLICVSLKIWLWTKISLLSRSRRSRRSYLRLVLLAKLSKSSYKMKRSKRRTVTFSAKSLYSSRVWRMQAQTTSQRSWLIRNVLSVNWLRLASSSRWKLTRHLQFRTWRKCSRTKTPSSLSSENNWRNSSSEASWKC